MFGIREMVSVFRCQVSGVRFQVSGFRCQVSVFSVQCSVFSVQESGVRVRVEWHLVKYFYGRPPMWEAPPAAILGGDISLATDRQPFGHASGHTSHIVEPNDALTKCHSGMTL